MVTPLEPLPPAPIRNITPNYPQVAETFVAALPGFGSQLNVLAQELNDLSEQAVAAAMLVAELDNKYLGPKASDPLLDNSGGALGIGALYFRTTAPQEVRVFTSAGWKGIGSYTAGDIDVTGYIRPAVIIRKESTFKNPPTANLLLNQFGSFIVDTNVNSQINFSYSALGNRDSVEFVVDLIFRAGASLVWPSTVRWSGGGSSPTWNAPAFTSNRRSLLKFYSTDGGASWLGAVLILNASLDNAPVIV